MIDISCTSSAPRGALLCGPYYVWCLYDSRTGTKLGEAIYETTSTSYWELVESVRSELAKLPETEYAPHLRDMLLDYELRWGTHPGQ